jgi:choice-of-anchor B domain-containing protein
MVNKTCMKKTLLSLSIFWSIAAISQTPCVDGMAGIYPCQNVDLIAYMPLANIGGGENTNDIWGWVSPNTGKEYALVGCSNGTAFVDISTPTSPIYLGLLPTHSTNSLWRDVETYNNYCFVGSEAQGHGLQIMDLLQLDNVTNPPVTFSESAYYGEFGNSHTLTIDTIAGFCYAMGTNTFSGGLHIVDINDPMNPTLAGGYSEDGYTHDGYITTYTGPDAQHIGHQIMVACNADALTIVDCTEKSDCQMLSTINYDELGYVHQGWFTKDNRYFILDDELDEQELTVGTRSHMFDLLDLDSPVYMGFHQSSNTSIDHNMYVLDQFVYQSNYRSGVRIFDASRIADGEINSVGYFDLYPLNDLPQFSGTWSNYPYLPSGVNLATSMYDGFFITKPNLVLTPTEAVLLCPPSDMSFDITINADLQFPLTVTIHDGDTNIPVTANTITEPGTYTIAVNEPFNSVNAILELNTDFGTQYEFAIEITSCVSTEEIVASNTAIQAYPNPTEGFVTLNTNKAHTIISIYNIVGKQVLNSVRADRNGSATIDMSQLPVGLYFARIGNKTIKLEKK